MVSRLQRGFDWIPSIPSISNEKSHTYTGELNYYLSSIYYIPNSIERSTRTIEHASTRIYTQNAVMRSLCKWGSKYARAANIEHNNSNDQIHNLFCWILVIYCTYLRITGRFSQVTSKSEAEKTVNCACVREKQSSGFKWFVERHWIKQERKKTSRKIQTFVKLSELTQCNQHIPIHLIMQHFCFVFSSISKTETI